MGDSGEQEPVLVFGHHPVRGQGWILTCNLEGEISPDELFIPGDLGDAGRALRLASESLHGSRHDDEALLSPSRALHTGHRD